MGEARRRTLKRQMAETEPMHGIDRITTVEMHTGGEPVRIVTGGYPPLGAPRCWTSGAMRATTSTICAGC